MSQFMKNALLWMAIVGMTFFAIQSVYDGPPKENMTYSEFISLVNKDQISTVSFRNDSWMIPYLSCMIVFIGMAAQFGLSLKRMRKREAA